MPYIATKHTKSLALNVGNSLRPRAGDIRRKFSEDFTAATREAPIRLKALAMHVHRLLYIRFIFPSRRSIYLHPIRMLRV